jgi:hypothetical protein
MIEIALLQAITVPRAADSLLVRLHADPSSNLQLWVPAAVAIAVVIVGSVVQWRIAKRQWKEQSDSVERQIVASLRSKTRLEWIVELRELLAVFLSDTVRRIRVVSTLAVADLSSERRAKLRRQAWSMDHLALTIDKLLLHLDVENESEAHLRDALSTSINHLREAPVPEDQVLEWSRRAGELQRAVLTAAWTVIREHSEAAGSGR